MDEYYDLGAHSRAGVSENSQAQIWFDRGLNWVYGYNHNEALVCFEKAIEADPDCAMAYWGYVYALGPNYNLGWGDFRFREKKNYLKKGMEVIEIGASVAHGVAAELIAALRVRFPDSAETEDFGPIHDAYAEAMRAVYAKHSTDKDICAFTAEALMNRTPWQLWDLPTGKPAEGADTVEAINIMETAFDTLPGAWQHPGLLHMYVHLMEMSPHPEKALRMGDALVGLVPDSGHLQHMATHIDVLCGHYENVVRRNAMAWDVDQKFIAREGTLNFYTTYICHDIHFRLYGAMFLGQKTAALQAATDLESILTPEVIEPSADWLESYYGMRQHVLIRFGEWEAILAQDLPEDQELYAFTTALIHYAKTVAYAATGAVEEAERERDLFRAAKKRVPETRLLFNNTCEDILTVAEAMLEGELSYRKGNHDEAFAHLRRSIELDDTLPYEEPWGWMQPTRHALGALLLEQGHVKEAEAVYRQDLGLDPSVSRPARHPDNVWSLHGLHECLVKTGQTGEAVYVKQRLDLANARADVPIKASCACRLNH